MSQESFVLGHSPNNKVITLGPIGCSIGTTRISVLTNWIHPLGLSVILCNWIIEFGGSGSLSTIVPITLSVSFTSRSTVWASVSSHRSECRPMDRRSPDRPLCDKLSGKSSDVLLRHKHSPILRCVRESHEKNLDNYKIILADSRSHAHKAALNVCFLSDQRFDSGLRSFICKFFRLLSKRFYSL